ncbi:unnamed protein product [Danaus chrysippus]|uniref:(African queen) hypothetical protein n=1 Tax=Danaus chrysippus TaxID=151541 RepID=A0A8J2QX52_9NEOP|nr:unnamed protein product [Danaus chrysippus]
MLSRQRLVAMTTLHLTHRPSSTRPNVNDLQNPGRSSRYTSKRLSTSTPIDDFTGHPLLIRKGWLFCKGFELYSRLAPINRLSLSRGRVAPVVDPGPVVTPYLHPSTPCPKSPLYRILDPSLNADIDSTRVQRSALCFRFPL